VGNTTGRSPNSSQSLRSPSSYGPGNRAASPLDGDSTATASPRRGLSGYLNSLGMAAIISSGG
jgi:hypothetical protein